MPDLRPVLGRDGTDVRREGGGPLPSLTVAERTVPLDDGPEGLRLPRSARNASAVRMMCNEFRSHSSELAPHAVIPCPPSTHPMACGLASLTAAMSSPS